jgi:hypothetical protein
MNEAKIIPFGKYRGQSVEVLQADPSYRHWLLSKGWFRSQHSSLYETIIHYNGELTETPEHMWLNEAATGS